VRPDAGEAIRLQLEPHRRAGGALRVPEARDALADAEELLDVVPELVRDDVGLRELAAGAELARELVEEAEVDVHLLVFGAVEGARRRVAQAAAGARRVRIKNELGVAVGPLLARELRLPARLHVVQDEGHEVDLGRLGLRSGSLERPPVGPLRIGAAAHPHLPAHDDEPDEKHDAPHPASHEPRHEEEQVADAAGLAHRRIAPAVDEVRAFVRVVPAHLLTGQRLRLRGLGG
jgi:hypothetical protein